MDTVTSPCEDVRASLISNEIITTGAAPQEAEPKNCNSRDTQPTDVASQQPVLSDIAPRETVGSHSPQETNSVSFARCETETEIEIVDLTNGQEREAASLTHESAPQAPETADCIRPQRPKIANRAVMRPPTQAIVTLPTPTH